MEQSKYDPPLQDWEEDIYTDDPDLPDVEDLELVEDFLPAPEALVFKQPKGVKITITLDPASVEFFKEEAARLNAPYQLMIRNLLSGYATTQKQSRKGKNQKGIA